MTRRVETLPPEKKKKKKRRFYRRLKMGSAQILKIVYTTFTIVTFKVTLSLFIDNICIVLMPIVVEL